MRFARLFRLAGLGLTLALTAACARQNLDEPPPDLGPFRLGLNIVVADNAQKVPISRDATAEEWEKAVIKAIDDRFGPTRYDGTRFYNIGINIDGYALAPPGIPVVAAPKSVVVISANIWDDANGQKLNTEARQFYVFESLSGESVIGTGLTSTKRQQMAALSFNVAKTLEGWFLENPQWFAAAGATPGEAASTATPAPTPQVVSAPVASPPVAPPAPSVRPAQRPAVPGQ
jgi:hypothetical protein